MLADLSAAMIGELAALAGLLLASAFFSGSETALFNLTRGEIHELTRGGWAGHLVSRLVARPRRLLNTLLLGNMLVNVAYSATAAVLVLQFQAEHMPGWAVGAMSVVPLLVLILLGEVTPKMLAYAGARQWALVAANPIALLQRVLSPLIWALDRALVAPLTMIFAPRTIAPPTISADELAALMRLSARRGILDATTSAMLQEIVELSEVRVAEVMAPRVELIAFDINRPRQQLIDLFAETKLRKIPVYDGQLDHALGVIHAKRLLLNPHTPLREMIRPVWFVPETARLDTVLAQFRQRRNQMAIVVDEYGGTAGLVTLEDVLEEIVGNIPDRREEPEPEPVVDLGDGRYRISGDLAVRDWAEAFDFPLEHGRISTVGGFVTSLLGRIARVGDCATCRNLTFTVEAMRGRRIAALTLARQEARP